MIYPFTARVRDLAGGTAEYRGAIEVADAGEHFDHVLEAETLTGDVLVPVGEKWLVGPEVEVQGSLRTTGGVIAFRPGG